MSRANNSLFDVPDIKVLIRNVHGRYLAGEAGNWFFTEDRAAAAVLYYRADRVAEQLEEIRRTHGVALVADPVPLEEIYETCDRCKELFMPFMTFFDGKRFLCEECRRAATRRGRPAESS